MSACALRPTPGELGLLADAAVVLPPQLFRHTNRKPPFDLGQTGDEPFIELATHRSYGHVGVVGS